MKYVVAALQNIRSETSLVTLNELKEFCPFYSAFLHLFLPSNLLFHFPCLPRPLQMAPYLSAPPLLLNRSLPIGYRSNLTTLPPTYSSFSTTWNIETVSAFETWLMNYNPYGVIPQKTKFLPNKALKTSNHVSQFNVALEDVSGMLIPATSISERDIEVTNL